MLINQIYRNLLNDVALVKNKREIWLFFKLRGLIPIVIMIHLWKFYLTAFNVSDLSETNSRKFEDGFFKYLYTATTRVSETTIFIICSELMIVLSIVINTAIYTHFNT